MLLMRPAAMKIGDSGPVRGPGMIRPVRGVRAASPSGTVEAAAPLADAASIAGIPESEITPKVRQALDMLMAEVQRMREELHRSQQRVAYLEKLADEDTLVPVANRRAFVRELGRMMAYAERYGARSSVVYFDIDGMKAINDAHGHAAGDAALRHVGDVLTVHIRESDIVGRLGGDEFGVILVQADARAAAEKAASLTAAIEGQPLDWEGHRLRLSVSWGAYTFDGKENAGEALDRADRAMYAHKQQRAAGGNGR